MEYDYKNGCTGHGLCNEGCHTGHYSQLNTYDYLADIPGNQDITDLVEVQFKNTRKGYYHNINHLPLQKGDIVAVESSPGHDIGTVTLTGKLVPLQLKKANLKKNDEIRRIYRKAREVDMQKYEEAKAREHETMIQSRQIAKDLGLDMKIGDVEYQGDGNKAIFYYIADGRVDFRQLIKVLAEAFHVRIEMKQIGARQEAGRIGGFGPCGRELCCATWMKNFVSVGTGAARFQDLSLNPQKLAGQCAKLKCCINYEVDQYIESGKLLPSKEIMLQSLEGDYYFFKADILGNMVTYSTDKRIAANLITISAARALEIIAMNKQGEKPATLEEGGHKEPERPIDLATQDDLNRFDKKKKKKKKNKSGEIRQQQEPVSASAQPKDANEVKDNRQPKEGNQSKENNRPPRDRNRNRRNPKGGKPQKNMPSNE
jgi:cell fate regulator YaaT (PSP1 superfamily)